MTVSSSGSLHNPHSHLRLGRSRIGSKDQRSAAAGSPGPSGPRTLIPCSTSRRHWIAEYHHSKPFTGTRTWIEGPFGFIQRLRRHRKCRQWRTWVVLTYRLDWVALRWARFSVPEIDIISTWSTREVATMWLLTVSHVHCSTLGECNNKTDYIIRFLYRFDAKPLLIPTATAADTIHS